MKPNVLKFKNDIKVQVAKQKETGDCNYWMHPMYCAYYILKHNVENPEDYIEEDIKRSYKALAEGWKKNSFRRGVKSWLEKYAEIICLDKQ